MIKEKIICFILLIFLFSGCTTLPPTSESRVVAKRPSCSLSPFINKVIIDAGHGGHDPGAVSRNGIKEKDVNLDIAKRLAKLFKDSGVEVAMTRTSDTFVSLPKRVSIANQSGADIFISIHSNANRTRAINGVEVYYILPSNNIDSTRAVLSARNNSLNLERDILAGSSLDLKATLWDMIYTANRSEAICLANAICNSIERDLGTRVLGVKSANFQVLRGTQIPAILVEVGYLSNAQEERLLRSGGYRQQVAEAITRGLGDYAQKNLLARSK